jgi:signal peptidase I
MTMEKTAQNKNLWGKFKFWLADTGKQLAIAIFIVMFLRSSIIEPYKIPSGSMIPTLFIGDQIFVNKFAYGLKVPFTEYFLDKPMFITQQQVPNRGDVIVFKYPRDESLNYIKRVVGLPGDTIAIRDKILYINNKPISEQPLSSPSLMEGVENDYDRSVLSLFTEDLMGVKHPALHDTKSLMGSDFGPIVVPPNRLFCMGDNRDRSSDSRAWGFVPIDNVKGRAMFVWLNFLLSFDPEFKFSLRLSRFATVIR